MEQRPHESGRAGGAYERRDLSVRAVGTFLAGMVLTVILVLVLMAWLFDYFSASGARREAPPSPLSEVRQIPPEPRLQVNAAADLKAMRAAEDAQLHSYGWMDRKAGTVHIPIERAMKLLAERGLAAPSQKGSTK